MSLTQILLIQGNSIKERVENIVINTKTQCNFTLQFANLLCSYITITTFEQKFITNFQFFCQIKQALGYFRDFFRDLGLMILITSMRCWVSKKLVKLVFLYCQILLLPLFETIFPIGNQFFIQFSDLVRKWGMYSENSIV